jgi:DNA polymerase-3 subunit delta
MVAVKAGDVGAALRKADPRIVVYLFYGPDTGLINERARALVERSIDDADDPFQLVRLDGDALAADPARLVDEAATVGLFGARRAIWVKATAKNLAPAVEPVLSAAFAETTVIIEGGDLSKSAPLRTLCERSPKALALPCYADSGRELGEIVDETLAAAGLTATREARLMLLASLGGDRLASRGELAKLVLYAHGEAAITPDIVDAVLSDVSGLAMDAVVDAAFAGDVDALETGFRRLMAEGMAPSVLLGAALRHAFALLSGRLDFEAGRPPGAVVEGFRGLHFRRRAAVEKHLQRWSAAGLKQAIRAVQAALLDTRRLSDLDESIAAKILLDLARVARR